MNQQSYESRILDHLGLPNDRSAYASMFDELELGPEIDRRIAQDSAAYRRRSQRLVSVGQAPNAMVLNGPGFVNRRLYLIPAFFSGQAFRAARRPGRQRRGGHAPAGHRTGRLWIRGSR